MEKIAASTNFARANSRRKTIILYVDALRSSTWRSEAEGLLNCPGQFARSARSAVQLVVPRGLNNVAEPPLDEWAGQIQSVWIKGATNTLELARIVSRARRAMDF